MIQPTRPAQQRCVPSTSIGGCERTRRVGAFATSQACHTRDNKRRLQSKTLGEINERLKQNGYFQKFSPEGIEVVSWYIVMGIGQVVTLRVPAERLREVNRAIEETAWGGYRTEFYPTYDYKAVAQQQRQSAK